MAEKTSDQEVKYAQLAVSHSGLPLKLTNGMEIGDRMTLYLGRHGFYLEVKLTAEDFATISGLRDMDVAPRFDFDKESGKLSLKFLPKSDPSTVAWSVDAAVPEKVAQTVMDYASRMSDVWVDVKPSRQILTLLAKVSQSAAEEKPSGGMVLPVQPRGEEGSGGHEKHTVYDEDDEDEGAPGGKYTPPPMSEDSRRSYG